MDTSLFIDLASQLDGEFYYDKLMQVIYATDASVYREMPLAVAIPKHKEDIRKIIVFANHHKCSIIPRAAGTSLAGQCVGDGIVVDVSKYMNNIIEYVNGENWIRVEPGIIRNTLNDFLHPHGYFFSPITSTANRATIGGMVGNNSCGTTSIQYGSTRDHVIEIKVILSDGSDAVFTACNKADFEKKCRLKNLEGEIYRQIDQQLSQESVRKEITEQFPKPSIHRRNTGYAVDYLANTDIYTESIDSFDFCKLICGSEGTLAFITEVKIHLNPLPPKEVMVVAAHFNSIPESLFATQIAMKHAPSMCELMDKIILDCTLTNKEQTQNRFFIQGDPAAVLMVEFRAETLEKLDAVAADFIQDLEKTETVYAFSKVYGNDTKKVWNLRSAGLGLLANIPGDKKAVACIEDTAVDLNDLPAYIIEFTELMKRHNQQCVYYAHVGAGELHLRPILDLKKEADVIAFEEITRETAELVKKYKGSFSGEHGDGRVRASFIPMLVGDKNYRLFENIKNTWDPDNIFNPGKIVHAQSMTDSLRYEKNQPTKSIDTIMDFSDTDGILRAAEKCNGSGDCRKLPEANGTMCPSFHATRNEKDTTRARANVLREFLTKSEKKNAFDHEEIKEVMDLCLSCKACASECPSNVDMASMKAEFLHQYYKENGIPLRARAFSNINKLNKINSLAPFIYNGISQNTFTSNILKKLLGVAKQRSFPTINKSLFSWYNKNYKSLEKSAFPIKELYLFCDEFTNYNDTEIGIKAIKLLVALGYEVHIIEHEESGRAAISKGMLNKAQSIANKLIVQLGDVVSEEKPLIGIEPSAILGFRDEIPRLVDKSLWAKARTLSKNSFTIEEFIAKEIRNGNITSDQFSTDERLVFLHGHCHQKALSNMTDSISMLSLPENYHIEMIPSGCCGMAGSFGYEKEHYAISQQIGETVLFPAVRKIKDNQIIAAAGTSCRHQIYDGTGKTSLHPVEILFSALL